MLRPLEAGRLLAQIIQFDAHDDVLGAQPAGRKQGEHIGKHGRKRAQQVLRCTEDGVQALLFVHARSQRPFGVAHRRNVAGQPEHPHQLAVAIPDRRLRGEEQAAVAVGAEGEPLFVAQGRPRLHHVAVARPEEVGQRAIGKFVIRLADQLRFVHAVERFETRIAECGSALRHLSARPDREWH